MCWGRSPKELSLYFGVRVNRTVFLCLQLASLFGPTLNSGSGTMALGIFVFQRQIRSCTNDLSSIMTEIESKVVGAWRQAADELGIKFSSPFTTTTPGGSFDCIGFVHHFGRRIGTIISVLDQPSSMAGLVGKWRSEDYFISVLGRGYSNYDRKHFVDTLDDWQYFGPDSERPEWYTGKCWGEK